MPRLTLPIVAGFGLLLILAAPLVIINHAAAFGEEIGWRSFIFAVTGGRTRCTEGDFTGWCSMRGCPCSVSLLWLKLYRSLSRQILVWYFDDGIFCCYCWYIFLLPDPEIQKHFPACIAHGAISAIREATLFICLDTYNALLGPKPSGFIGMISFAALGAAIWVKLPQYPET